MLDVQPPGVQLFVHSPLNGFFCRCPGVLPPLVYFFCKYYTATNCMQIQFSSISCAQPTLSSTGINNSFEQQERTFSTSVGRYGHFLLLSNGSSSYKYSMWYCIIAYITFHHKFYPNTVVRCFNVLECTFQQHSFAHCIVDCFPSFHIR